MLPDVSVSGLLQSWPGHDPRCENHRVHQMGGVALYTSAAPRRSAEIPWQQCDSLVLYCLTRSVLFEETV